MTQSPIKLTPFDRRIVRGFEPLITERQAIEILGLADRRNPPAALRHLIRMRRLTPVRHGRGVIAFTRGELDRYIAALTEGLG